MAPGTTTVDITDWLVYFAQTILKAQKITEQTITFVIAKTHFFDYFQGALNPRQEKVILLLFAQGPEVFKGGLSAENYMKITGVSSAAATRDLLDLVQKRALTRTVMGRYTRYGLDLSTAT